MSEETTIWYGEAAEQWCDALPLGNGRMGAMVYGGWLRRNKPDVFAGLANDLEKFDPAPSSGAR